MSRNSTTIPPKSVTIRGVSYKDQHEAATFLGVGQSTISRAMMRGTLDNVGLCGRNRKHGKSGSQPVTIDGTTYKSKKTARKSLGLGIRGLEDAIAKEGSKP